MVKEHGAEVGMVWCQKVYLCIIGLHKLYTPRSLRDTMRHEQHGHIWCDAICGAAWRRSYHRAVLRSRDQLSANHSSPVDHGVPAEQHAAHQVVVVHGQGAVVVDQQTPALRTPVQLYSHSPTFLLTSVGILSRPDSSYPCQSLAWETQSVATISRPPSSSSAMLGSSTSCASRR